MKATRVNTRWRLVAALVVVVCVIGLLVRTAITHASTYYVTVAQYLEESPQDQARQTTISGEIIGSSVQWNPQTRLLRFDIEDKTGGPRVHVTYQGDKPDDFSNNWPVVVTGRRQPTGDFLATNLLIKCPSKYEAANQTAQGGSQ
ncbi:MAG: cytochrome c maturation protein CcmE [Alicyclobacillus sp.]|nr:cytochrome c maturation protein CcmE [Alicyclobacillus sp.]